ncbi:helix-turn-helix transcriptional regulator [Pedobacter glucosidilyticus]|uniref:helix-turn-helix transcriptional regulator n=1 Tax=Pedobacter glucosidilyticus TaxID=1122941 RepID=UPI001FE1B2AF|nr:YafY family protein [Pedobacter glucosidilyticus]
MMQAETLNRFNRIVSIFIHLQAGRIVRAQELAQRFQVSLRTIYRDIKSLEAAGVPISGEAGIGYYLMEGYRVPPTMFTPEEVNSFVASEKLMQKFSDKNLSAHYESAMFKLKSVLRGQTKDRVTTLENQVWINTGHDVFNDQVPDALNILLDSMAEKKQVTIRYQNLHAEEIVERIIEPIGVFNENNFWYMMAFCLLRQDYRQFRTDRIFYIAKTEHRFSKKHSPELLDEYRKAIEGQKEKTKVVIKIDKDIARYLSTGRKYYGFVSEKVIRNSIEMTFMTNDTHESFARWFMMFADKAEIIEPDSLKERIAEIIAAINIKLR